MAMRMTGLISGMDTESMVKELVAASSKKVDKVKQNKQKTEWKKEAWQDLNTKIYNFYKTQLAAFKTNGNYKSKKATVNDETKVSVKAGSGTGEGTHVVSVKQLASSAYLTGANIKLNGGSYTNISNATGASKFADMEDGQGNNLGLAGQTISIGAADGETMEFVLGGDGDNGVASIDELNKKLSANDKFKGLTVGMAEGKLTFTNNSSTTSEDGVATGTSYRINADAFGIRGTVGYDKEDDGNIISTDFGGKIRTDFTSADIKNSTLLSDIGIQVGTSFSIKGKDFVVDSSTKISDLTDAFSKMGVTASFDEKQGRFYINASASGSENDFTITSSDNQALDILGLGSGATKIDARDAIIEYNGVEYQNASNTIELNGLTITAKAVTGKYDPQTGAFTDDVPINVEVSADTESSYKMVKDFVKAYNDLIDEMNTLYNESKSEYEPLTEEERSKLSDTQIEQWEKKAKQGLLRRDSTIESLLSNMRNNLNKAVNVTLDDGSQQQMTLASLGIVTGDYSERGKLHILGDEDDPEYSGETNKLREALTKNADVVAQVFAGSTSNPGIGSEMYSSMTKAMRRIEGVSSSLTFYNDLTMKDEIDDYDDEIDKWAEKLQKMEDKYYDQFAAMEAAMAKLQQQQAYLGSLMGTA